MSAAVATHQPGQSLGSPKHKDRKALVSSDGKTGIFMRPSLFITAFVFLPLYISII